jgi:hypothetical protein
MIDVVGSQTLSEQRSSYVLGCNISECPVLTSQKILVLKANERGMRIQANIFISVPHQQ